jgi:serine/threonine-protein kinase
VVVVLFAPGDSFEGYRILRVLPPEGEIQRFLASDEAGGEVLLYCRIKRKASSDEVEEIDRRVEILRGLDHPRVPRVVGAGYARGSFFWIAVTAPSGKSLRDLRDEDPGEYNLSDILVLAHEIASVLDAALEKQIAHFGLTPAHIYVDEESFELTSIVSLGIRMALDAPPSHPREEIIYRAPEQVRRQAADHRADIYAFGMILYELIAGEAAFLDQLRAMGVTDIKHASDMLLDAIPVTAPTRLCDRVDGLEASVETAVFVMINKKPEQRPGTWRQVLSGLTNVSASVAVSLAMRGPAERAAIDRILDGKSTLSFREIVARYSDGGGGDTGAPLKAATPEPAPPELPPASEPLPEEVAPRVPRLVEGNGPANDSKPTELKPSEPEPGDANRERASPSGRSAPAPRVNGALAVGLLLAGIGFGTSLLWLLHPVRPGEPQPPVVVQIPAPPSRDPSSPQAPPPGLPVSGAERSSRASLPRAAAAFSPSAEVEAPPPPKEEPRFHPRDVKSMWH